MPTRHAITRLWGPWVTRFAHPLRIDQGMFDHRSLRPNTTSWLVYSAYAPNPAAKILQDFYPWDDTELVPSQPMSVVPYDRLIAIDVDFAMFNGINLAIMNNNTYVAP